MKDSKALLQKKICWLLVLFLVMINLFPGCTASKDPLRNQLRHLQDGSFTEDTSFVYQLPYAVNKSYRVAQGYFSSYSHRNRAAIDFKMKVGTPVHAARGGVVIRVKEDGKEGGWNRKYRPQGNHVVVQHADSSRAGYWHLKNLGALVNIGDTVATGQLIALSGRTGYALFPHLHFLVWRNNKEGRWQQTGTRFKTSKGNIYLRPLRKYKHNNPKSGS